MSNIGRKEPGTGRETPCSSNGFIKSSAYAPVSLNLMGMYLIKEHMNAHYKRIYNVKAAVDTRARAPPNAQTRTRSSGPSRANSRCSSHQSSNYIEEFRDDRRRDNLQLIDKIDKYLNSVADDASSSNSIKNHHRFRETSKNAKVNYQYRVGNGDKNDYFSRSNKSFTAQKMLGARKDTTARKFGAGSAYSNREKRVVPQLRIQRDLDHARWLEAQARKLRAEEKLNELELSLGTESDDDTVELFDEPERLDRPDCDDLINKEGYEKLRHLNSTSVSQVLPPRRSVKRYSSTRLLVKEQLEAEEEELKYLEFITDVTNDILLRGVYTDRALKQVFQYHMNRRNDLEFKKMKNLLGKLQDDLGIPRFEKQFSSFVEPNSNGKENFVQTSTKMPQVSKKSSQSPEKLESPVHINSADRYRSRDKKTLVHFSPELEQIEKEEDEEGELTFNTIEPTLKRNLIEDEDEKSEKAEFESELSERVEDFNLSDASNEEQSEDSFGDDLQIDVKNDNEEPSVSTNEDKEIASIMNYSDEDFCSSASDS